MSPRLADAVQRVADRSVTQGGTTWQLAMVTAVNTDGTVDITTATGPALSIRRLRSYGGPQVGDRVRVSRRPTGDWIVDGATATAADDWQALTLRSGFSASTTAGDPAPTCRRTSDGLVALSGIILAPSLSTSASTVMADMPSGIRPQFRGACLCVGDAVSARVYINRDGTVSARLITGASPAWISLDGAQCR